MGNSVPLAFPKGSKHTNTHMRAQTNKQTNNCDLPCGYLVADVQTFSLIHHFPAEAASNRNQTKQLS